MNKTRAQLMRDLKNNIGKELKCDYHFINDRKDKKRIIKKVQTNAIVTVDENDKTTCMEIPNAKNVEYNNDTFSLYSTSISGVALRDVTNDEAQEYKRIMEDVKTFNESSADDSDMTMIECDMMTDLNRCYFHEIKVWKNSTISKLKGKIKDEKVQDDSLRGKLEMTFVIA